jgi:hypothetical protein
MKKARQLSANVLPDPEEWAVPPNKALKLTSVEHIERSQLSLGVRRRIKEQFG